MRKHGIRPEDIETITVTLNPYEADYPGVDNPGPFGSAIATKLSTQFSLALAAIEGRITPDGLERLADGAILSVSRRVVLHRDPAILLRLCRVEIRLRDRTEIIGIVETPAGQPDFSECAEFARTLGPEIGATVEQMEKLIDMVAGLENAPDIHGLMAAAAGCG